MAAIRSDEGLTLETPALKLFTVANLQIINSVDKPNYPVRLSHRRNTTVSSETYPLCLNGLLIDGWTDRHMSIALAIVALLFGTDFLVT